MVYRMALYPPSRWGGARNITNIQNNFYGTRSSNNYMPIPFGQSCCRPTYCYSGYSWMPPFVQNAMTRLMSFNFMNALFNPNQTVDPYVDPQQLLAQDLHATDDELAEVNGRYDVQA